METIILFGPLIGALICGFGWKFIGEQAGCIIATGLLFLSALLSWIVFLTFDGTTETIEIMRWIQSGTLDTSWSIRMDRLTTIMLIVVTTVSSLVHLYSFGYMAHDEHFGEGVSYKPRFFAYLSFFTFTMLMLVTSDNLVQMFFGWEGVGVASYLLIGFYYKKPSANAAAIKAFVVNRVGDFGFALGIMGLFFLTDSINFSDIFEAAPTLAETQLHFLWTEWNAANLLAFLLFIGAMGKSAQLFLHTWLPDAMEGPTPVSALIHAATMVTAGVFLVCRMSPLIEFAPEAKAFIVIIGASTAFFAATVGLVQNDIKRVIAYSTCSQLGYMFVAAGVGVYSVAMFHLLTHAFFKAMLFLGAGSVIHAMHHEQDMRNYGNLRKKIPYTFWAMMIGTLAITGVGIPLTHIGFAGFLSKDAIIESAWGGGSGYAFWLLVIAAVFTSFYSWRLMFMTFFGTERGDKHTHEHAHESPKTMLIPLGVLAIGAVFSGMVFFKPFFGDHHDVEKFFGITQGEQHALVNPETLSMAAVAATSEEGDVEGGEGEAALPGQGAIYMAPDNHTMDNAHHAPAWVKVSPFIAMLLGLFTAWMFYIKNPSLPGRLAANQPHLYQFLLNKWYFDELYDVIFIRPAKWLGNFLWTRGDGKVIDGSINGVAMGAVPFLTRLAGRAQSGFMFHYAFAMVIGVVLIITWFAIGGPSIGGAE
ncbi:NADH dehydrogenase subunit L [Litoreibacter halocynthiae]|uniref:NADH dehydrogenase subunit L n=1 Tax=Litoreibacter halocynthiae TaxID=1242689 RepID=A0A4R7LLE3_9RHOB|nr:NADH-quinone oxidoreductase subunit L [Litoreibacter halocynthiae]TDT74930.1 NADH dehydrogenase subunit L [Litoreibacter halocynthiae]